MSEKEIHIGIDQSLGFTGVTVYRDSEHVVFYGITHKKHTKWDKLQDKPYNVTILDCPWEDKSDDYTENERIKLRNIKNIVLYIQAIFEDLKKRFSDYTIDVRMEGISFGSRTTTALAELSALNFFLRDLCSYYGFEFTILPPTKVKKFATGNGQASKDLMLNSFLVLHPDLKDISKIIKLDDIADSYFMASYDEDEI